MSMSQPAPTHHSRPLPSADGHNITDDPEVTTLATPLHALPDSPNVVVLDGVVVITDLEETDPVVVDLVREADDADGTVRSLLHVGARAVRAAGVSVDTEVIDRRFDSMTEKMDHQLDDALTGLSKAIGDAIAEDGGAIPVVLDKHRDSLEALLGSTFDPDSKTSVISLIEKVVDDARRSQVEAIAGLVAVDGDDSPLAKLRSAVSRDLKDHMKEHLDGVRDEVRAVSERIAVNEAVAPVIAITTAKGFTFEDVLHARLEALADGHGDVAEQTGTTQGVLGTKKGDEVVTLNREDTRGAEIRFVVEAKASKLSLRKAYEELDAAIVNRAAGAGMIVFSSQEQAPTSLPFQYSDDRAIVVFDEDDQDDGALRLAYMWARWVARRNQPGAEADELDCERIAALIDQARSALNRVKTIRSGHSKALNAIEQAGGEVTRLAEEVTAALADLAEVFETA